MFNKKGKVPLPEPREESVPPSITESMIADYDADTPVKCQKCQHLVVPQEARACSCFQACHMLCCFICILQKWCSCDKENEDLKKIVLLCPNCNNVIAAH